TSLVSNGCSTMEALMRGWAQDVRRFHPGLSIAIAGAGSASAPPSLAERRGQLGHMSRPMTAGERDAVRAARGGGVGGIVVALDTPVVFVHHTNPLESISLDQLDAIYSATRRLGRSQPVRMWGQLGLTGIWADRAITAYNRDAVSGTHEVFRTIVL